MSVCPAVDVAMIECESAVNGAAGNLHPPRLVRFLEVGSVELGLGGSSRVLNHGSCSGGGFGCLGTAWGEIAVQSFGEKSGFETSDLCVVVAGFLVSSYVHVCAKHSTLMFVNAGAVLAGYNCGIRVVCGVEGVVVGWFASESMNCASGHLSEGASLVLGWGLVDLVNVVWECCRLVALVVVQRLVCVMCCMAPCRRG